MSCLCNEALIRTLDTEVYMSFTSQLCSLLLSNTDAQRVTHPEDNGSFSFAVFPDLPLYPLLWVILKYLFPILNHTVNIIAFREFCEPF